MYLNDIAPGSRISIRAVDREHPENSVEVTTDVIEQLMDTRGHHVAFASPIFIDDKVLSTNEGRSVFDVYYFDPEQKRVYEWRHTPVRYVLCKNRRCYILVSDAEGVLTNRRDTFRIPLTEPCIIQVGENKKTYEGYVHDISAMGIAVTLPKMEEAPLFKAFSIVFSDSGTRSRFRLSATCRHVLDYREDIILCGCELHKNSPMLSSFVNRKQIDAMKKQSGQDLKYLNGSRFTVEKRAE